MFKGLITKAVKDFVVNPIMNPTEPVEPTASETTASASVREPATRSEYDPQAFDQPGARATAFDPDAFDAKSEPRSQFTRVLPTRHDADPDAARALMLETWDIELPFFPGEGTSCGRSCQCAWRVEQAFSADFGGEAVFATWIPGGACTSCADCLRRAEEWTSVFVRPVTG